MLRKIAQRVGYSFVLFHALAIAVCSLAQLGYFTPIAKLSRYLKPYIYGLGTTQNWKMFHTIAYRASIDVDIVAETGTKRTVYGPLLPGLRKYDSNVRADLFFVRYRSVSMMWPYAKLVCRAIKEKEGAAPERVFIRYKESWIKELSEIRKDGISSNPSVYEMGPFPC